MFGGGLQYKKNRQPVPEDGVRKRQRKQEIKYVNAVSLDLQQLHHDSMR